MATKDEMIFAMQAVRVGLLDREQVDQALALQRALDEQQADRDAEPIALARILVSKGFLSRTDFERLRDGIRAAPEKTAPIADDIPGFRILARIGAGGMANVYRAVRERDGLVVALKVLFPTQARNPRFVEQFLHEAAVVSRFDNRHIVRGYDFGFTGDRYFMALENIGGVTVQELLDQKGSLPPDFACFVILRVARALDYLAAEGFVHRDIKPDNILVSPQGLVKIIDFGFATPYAGGIPEANLEITCGTVEYISPEQARGDRDLDPRADLYSLGATLYHMVLGEVPFSGEDAYEVMAKQVQEKLSNAVKQRGVPQHVHFFIEKLMVKDRDLRYPAAGEFVAEVERVLEGMGDVDIAGVVPSSTNTASFDLQAIQAENEARDADSRATVRGESGEAGGSATEAESAPRRGTRKAGDRRTSVRRKSRRR